ncbi:hypothetical protein R3P38DRAFT_3285692 [Favolaschia claudopus]|uniref:F-box domain-containing protein n=1 Tax=Favolaschia claudopus TaxID=2862362 RepID=A0AAW0A3M1_9AGAR
MSAKLTIQAQRDRVERLVARLEARKLAVRDAEVTLAAAKRTLNSLVDPMARLPLELQSGIFLLTGTDHEPDPDGSPLNLLFVCHMWHDIAVATPRLWNRIVIESLPREADFARACGNWMKRAHPFPLSVELRQIHEVGESMQKVLCQYARSIEKLEISLSDDIPWDECNEETGGLYLHTSPFEIHGASFSSLKTLSLKSHVDGELQLTDDDWIDLLAAAPELVECQLMNFAQYTGNLQPDIEHLTLASLRQLQLEASSWSWVTSTATMLLRLTLPALESLYISTFDISGVEMQDFLTRSSPPLQSLVMAIPQIPEPMSVVAGILPLVPSLTDLDLSDVVEKQRSNEPFLAFLKMMGSNPDILPNLQNLTISPSHPYKLDFTRFTELLLQVFATRHQQLKSFQLLFGDSKGKLSDDIISGFKKIGSNGIDFHVGPYGTNWLDD